MHKSSLQNLPKSFQLQEQLQQSDNISLFID